MSFKDINWVNTCVLKKDKDYVLGFSGIVEEKITGRIMKWLEWKSQDTIEFVYNFLIKVRKNIAVSEKYTPEMKAFKIYILDDLINKVSKKRKTFPLPKKTVLEMLSMQRLLNWNLNNLADVNDAVNCVRYLNEKIEKIWEVDEQRTLWEAEKIWIDELFTYNAFANFKDVVIYFTFIKEWLISWLDGWYKQAVGVFKLAWQEFFNPLL